MFLAACGAGDVTEEPTTVVAPTVQENLPKVLSVVLDRVDVPNYEIDLPPFTADMAFKMIDKE
jgi:hypothetical protein